MNQNLRDFLWVSARKIWRALPESVQHNRWIEDLKRKYMNNQHVHPVESSVSKGSGIRVVSSLSELDQIMLELDAAAAISDDELRRVFTTFAMKFPTDLPEDPHSEAYADRQFELYKYLAGKSYHPSNEVTVFDVPTTANKPFPFSTESPQTVGNQLIAIGHVIRTLNLPPKSSILEFGPGWGNTTLCLARMGYKVSAIDIEKRFVDLIAERARRKQLEIELIHGDFSVIHSLGRRYDAVLFFESFHHCADHRSLIEGLKKVVAPGGKVVFAAEPITDGFPMPWGFRLDGESLWAIRRHGWCELGFQESYFRDLLDKHGWAVSKHVCAETPWGVIFVATHRDEGVREERHKGKSEHASVARRLHADTLCSARGSSRAS